MNSESYPSVEKSAATIDNFVDQDSTNPAARRTTMIKASAHSAPYNKGCA